MVKYLLMSIMVRLKYYVKRSREVLAGRVLHVRAGLLSGMFDYTDRLPYWIQRVAKGGKVLVPGRKDRPVQLVDIKDVASFGLDMAENNKAGTFNITGPNDELTMEELLNTCKRLRIAMLNLFGSMNRL